MLEWFEIWAPHLIALAFMAAFGACVGSFVNVIAYRMPLGMSIVNPPSRCCTCGRRLKATENIPIIGWVIARGRCWSCGAAISIEYPAIELLMALLFAAVYAVLFVVDPHGWWGVSGAKWFQTYGLLSTAPALLAILTLVACLVAATLTDIRTFTIPIGVTTTATIAGILGWTIQGVMASPTMCKGWPLPTLSIGWIGVAIGCAVGEAISLILLETGILKRSFADYEEFVREGETLGEYPHARREMRKELLFLLPIALGAALGWATSQTFLQESQVPPWLQGWGGATLGYMAGAGVVWFVRIVASLAKGIEAMGLGDVHLVGAAGAALGWVDPIAAFFIAPFFGLAWVGGDALAARVKGLQIRRELPYGPHLAIAVISLVLLRPVFVDLGHLLFPGLIPSARSLHRAAADVQYPHLSDCPKVQPTSEKGLSNDEEDMVSRWQRGALAVHGVGRWL